MLAAEKCGLGQMFHEQLKMLQLSFNEKLELERKRAKDEKQRQIAELQAEYDKTNLALKLDFERQKAEIEKR